jgi:hypothetical protein
MFAFKPTAGLGSEKRSVQLAKASHTLRLRDVENSRLYLRLWPGF